MKKLLLVTVGALAGVLLEKKFEVFDKAVEFGKKTKDAAKKKIREAVKSAEENLEELKEEEKSSDGFEETK